MGICAALWLGKVSPDDVPTLVRKVDVESEPLLLFMIAERLKKDKKVLQAKVNYVKALDCGNSIWRPVIEYYRSLN